ncbi:MAG: hypothetical protein RR390_13115, partial [Hafnia sp.]
GVSDKSAQVQRPRAGGLCPYAFISVSMKLSMSWRTEYYIVVTSMTGERNISLKPHKQQEGKILTSEIYQQNLTPS